MIDERVFTEADIEKCLGFGSYVPYNPKKPRIKDIIWKNYDWLEELDASGKARPVILDNIQRTLLCKTLYLGYDAFDCDKCDNWIWLYRHCRSRFCSSCGIKLQKSLATKAEVLCVDASHRHMVFTIPEEYRELFRNYENINIFGEIATLHTFGRDLKWNPHIHALVPELVYNAKNNSIKHINHFNYESLGKTWMYEINRLLKDKYPKDKKIKSLINKKL